MRVNQDLLAMERMGKSHRFARGRRKKKRKKKKRKKKKERSKGHPRKKLKFDDSCECGVAPKPTKHGGLWVRIKLLIANWLVSSLVCGVRMVRFWYQRVVNGVEASLGSHPWAGGLVEIEKTIIYWQIEISMKRHFHLQPSSVSLEQESGAYFCGGSIISNKCVSFIVIFV